MMHTVPTSDALRALLGGAVDYAGLFPPAQLDMATAVRNYAGYRAGVHSWMLGRFIVPVSRLNEFEGALSQITPSGDWRISALTGTDPVRDVASVFAFNKRREVIIDAFEVKASTISDIDALTIPSLLTTFVEIPLDPDPTPLIAAIKRHGFRAKARTGGVTAEAFPPSKALARFMRACIREGVPFKATAGLHHPLRAAYRLTYQPDAPTGIMYGFLNLLVAAGLSRAGANVDEVVAALEETSAAAFVIGKDHIAWRGHRIALNDIHSLRTESVISFGSCSFTEPIDDLKSLGLL